MADEAGVEETPRLDALAAAIKKAGELLAGEGLEPDPSRRDWRELEERLRLVREGIGEVLGALDGALAEADAEGEDLARLIRERVAELLARAAVLLRAGGDGERFSGLLARAAGLAPGEPQRALLEAAAREADLYARYHHGLWLRHRGRVDAAEKRLLQVSGKSREPALREAARSALRGLRPRAAAPPLARIAGCGVGLFGRWNAEADGSCVTYYCLSVLFVPVLPLRAYRVRSDGRGTWEVLAREPFGPVARLWQVLVLAGLLAAAAAGGRKAYLESPARLAQLALADARRMESIASRELALNRYRGVVAAYPGTEAVTQAMEAVVRLSLAGLKRPCTREAVDPAERVVAGFETVPGADRAGAPTARLVEAVGGCAAEVGEATEADLQANLALVGLAIRMAGAGAEAVPLEERQARLRKALADRVAGRRPLRALALYALLPQDPAAVEAAGALIAGFGDAPSRWVDAEPQVVGWMALAGPRFQARLEAARAARAQDEALIATGDEKKLAQALRASPGNQELAVALAHLARRRGDLDGALARLAGLGPPGHLTAEAQALLGACHRDLGQLAEADQVLTEMLEERGPLFQQAQRRYDAAADELRERLLGKARDGVLPLELMRRVEEADELGRQELLQEWLSQEMEKDPALDGLRADYLRHEAVVPAALTLGGVKLRRAGEAAGEARQALLRDAERVFLSIRREAEGEPGFHLGLGQVYHRLGRPEDGDRELESVLARKDAELSLEVAAVYRELDLVVPARAICEEVYASAPEQGPRQRAAYLRSRMAEDLDEDEQWLRRSDLDSPYIQESLLEVQAQRHLRDGQLDEADRAYARITASRERSAKHNAVAANNAAVAYFGRYAATGDAAHLRTAVGHLEAAARLAPDNALVLGNLADGLGYLGAIEVLGRWVHARELRLDAGEAQLLLGALRSGPRAGEVRAAMARQPELLRSLELGQQEQVLAPQKAAAWRRQMEWLRWRRDEAGLAALARRLEGLPPMDSRQLAEERRKWVTGARDAQLGKQMAQRVIQGEARRDRVRPSGHGPTLAAAWLLLGEAQHHRLFFEKTPEALEAMLASYRQAVRAWPGSGMERFLRYGLLHAALERAAGQSPALAAALGAELRVYPAPLLLHRLLEGDRAEEVRRAVRARPELREAADLVRQAARGEPELDDWMLARAAGDAELERAAAAVFERPEVRWALEIEARLSGGLEVERAWLEVYRRKSP